MMGDSADKHEQDNYSAARKPGETNDLDRVQELIWALLDDYIDDVAFSELEGLLQHDGIVREHYIQCVQLHTDLASYFATTAGGSEASDSEPNSTPVLGFLSSGLPLAGLDTSSAEDAT